jgi:hypothetical protein
VLCVAVRARADWLANRLLTPQHTALPFPQGYAAKVALRVASPGRASISAVRGLLRMQNQVTASVKRDDPAQTQTQRQMQTQSSSGSTDGAGGAGTPASGEQQRPKREGQSQRTQQGHEVVSISAPSTERADALFAEVQQVGGASGGTVTMEAVEAWSGPGGPISKAFRLRHGGGGGSGGSPTRGGLDLRSAMRQACHAAAAGSVRSADTDTARAIAMDRVAFGTALRYATYFNNMQREFEAVDVDHNRYISLEEFKDGAAVLDLHLTQEEAAEQFCMIDAAGRGQIPFQAFCAFCVETLCGIEDYIAAQAAEVAAAAAAAAEEVGSAPLQEGVPAEQQQQRRRRRKAPGSGQFCVARVPFS